MCFVPQRRALFRHLNLQKWSEPLVFLTFWLPNVLRATTACTFSTSELPKVVRTPSVFNILTSKCASRHNGVHFSTSQLPKVARTWCVFYVLTWKCALRRNGVHFLDISTSKSGPRMVCFLRFDLFLCFSPQWRALFRHRNFQKWSEAGAFCTFSLRNVLRATTACNFSSLIWPAGSAPAALASLLFDPPEPQIIGKNTVFRDFPTFSRICIFFLLTLLSSNLSLLSASSLLCFSSVHIVGSLTSKLPSIINDVKLDDSPIYPQSHKIWMIHKRIWRCPSTLQATAAREHCWTEENVNLQWPTMSSHNSHTTTCINWRRIALQVGKSELRPVMKCLLGAKYLKSIHSVHLSSPK